MNIYKYSIPIGAQLVLEMPEGAVVISAQVQKGEPQLWAIVDPMKPTTKRRFVYFGTGHFLSLVELKDLVFVATLQVDYGNYVFHLFEKIR